MCTVYSVQHGEGWEGRHGGCSAVKGDCECAIGCSDLVLFFDFTIWPPFMNEIYLF